MHQRRIRQLAKQLKAELECSRLEVCKIRSKQETWGYIRVAVSQNAPWYQDFCSNYMRSRKRYPKVRTIIKRNATLAALDRIAAGNFAGVYAERLLAVIESEAKNRGAS